MGEKEALNTEIDETKMPESAKYEYDIKGEIRRIKWPSALTVAKKTAQVAIMTAFLTLIIAAGDSLGKWLVDAVASLL